MKIFETRPITLWGKALTEEEAREMAEQYEAHRLAQKVIDYIGLDDDMALELGHTAAINRGLDESDESALAEAMWYFVEDGDIEDEVRRRFIAAWEERERR